MKTTLDVVQGPIQATVRSLVGLSVRSSGWMFVAMDEHAQRAGVGAVGRRGAEGRERESEQDEPAGEASQPTGGKAGDRGVHAPTLSA